MAEPKTVLVVDDASLARRYYKSALQAAGFEVREAMNGIEALETLMHSPADLLIVDVNMPRMDGLTFLRLLRQREGALASIPALVTSTESGPQDVLAARAAGANYYLPKPVDPQTLVQFVSMFCGQRR